MTTCVPVSRGGMPSTKAIEFTDVKTAYVIANLSKVNTEGQFTCEKPGFYLISAFVMSELSNAHMFVYKNTKEIAHGHFGSGTYNTCSLTVFEQLSFGDTISVNINGQKYVTWFGNKQTCLSVLKIN